MALDPRLLDILRCPVSGLPMLPLSRARLRALNQAIAARSLRRLDQQIVQAPIQAALITRDAQRIYRIDDNIPVLLDSEAIHPPAGLAEIP